jgi:hypothetical protein
LNGGSDNDLDIVLYPHDSTKVRFDELREVLRKLGMIQIETVRQVHARWRDRGTTDQKHIELWMYDGRKVDNLFVGEP